MKLTHETILITAISFMCVCFGIGFLKIPKELKGGVMTKLSSQYKDYQEMLNEVNENQNNTEKRVDMLSKLERQKTINQ